MLKLNFGIKIEKFEMGHQNNFWYKFHINPNGAPNLVPHFVKIRFFTIVILFSEKQNFDYVKVDLEIENKNEFINLINSKLWK